MTGWIRVSLLPLMLFTLASTALLAEAREFRLGIISDKQVEKKLEKNAPFARYVAERLKSFGVTSGKVVVTKDVDAMLQKIGRKEVDVVLESAFSTIIMSEKGGMEPKLLVWKHGVREYRTIFFVRKDSPINDLVELKGKVIALEDTGSTSGFLIPISELKGKGLEVVASSDAKVPPSAVRYVLVAHEKNQVFWVTEKRADAGAFGSDDWEKVKKVERRDLKAIHATKPVLRYLASFHPGLPADLSRAISTILVQMDDNPEGKRILEDASGISKMEPLSAQDYKSLEYVRRLMQGR